MTKWICKKCQAINPAGSFKCHNCLEVDLRADWYTAVPYAEEKMENKKPEPQASVETPWGRILRHRRDLDSTLLSIKGYSEESKLVRMFIVGQIESLDWAVRFFGEG